MRAQEYQLLLYACTQGGQALQNSALERDRAGVHHVYRLYADRKRYGAADVPAAGLFCPQHDRAAEVYGVYLHYAEYCG